MNQLQEQAAEHYRQSLSEGVPLSATKLGEMHGRSRSWARAVIAETVAADRSNGGRREVHSVDGPGSQNTVTDRHGNQSGSHPKESLGLTGSQPVAVEPVINSAGFGEIDKGLPVAARWQTALTALAVVVVAAVAAVISYSHMRSLALAAGEDVWAATLLPLSVDGMLLAASMSALVRKRSGQAVGGLPVAAILLGVAASVAANIASAEPTVVGRAVASWPPLALLVSLELLLRQSRGTHR